MTSPLSRLTWRPVELLSRHPMRFQNIFIFHFRDILSFLFSCQNTNTGTCFHTAPATGIYRLCFHARCLVTHIGAFENWNISKFRSLQVQTGRQCWGRDCAGGRHHLCSRLWGRRWERLEVHRPVLLPGQIETYFPINNDEIMLVVTHSWQLYLHEHAKRWRQWLCAGDKLEIRHPVYYPGGADNCIIASFWMMINWSIKDAMNNVCFLPLSNLAIAILFSALTETEWVLAFPIVCLKSHLLLIFGRISIRKF